MSFVLICLLASRSIAQQGYRPEETRYPLRARCAINLIEIGKHIQLFTLAREGILPSKLSEVFVDTSKGWWRCLVCPSAKPAIVEGGFYTSYAYVNVTPDGRKIEDCGEDILVFDAEPAHQNGRNVLFTNMKVKYLEEPDFQKLLAKQRAKWEMQGKKLEIVRQDFIPLDETQLRNLNHERRSFFSSVHSKIALAIMLAIAVVAAFLVLKLRKRRTPTSQ